MWRRVGGKGSEAEAAKVAAARRRQRQRSGGGVATGGSGGDARGDSDYLSLTKQLLRDVITLIYGIGLAHPGIGNGTKFARSRAYC